MPYVADRVQETTSTTGTGTVTLAGAVSGYQTFAAGFDEKPCNIYYLLVSSTSWETGIGFLDATGATLTRDTVLQSSNSNAKITLAGTSNVYGTAPSELIDNANNGHITALKNGLAMP